MRRVTPLAAVVAALAFAPPAGADTTLNIVPWGQHQPGASWASDPAILPAPTQALMYDRLTPKFRDVTDADLTPSNDGSGYFKSEALLDENDPSFVTSDVVSGTVAGRDGALTARIRRDAYGVANVYSDTDDGVIFGAGYVTAQDRFLLLAVARKDAYAAAVDIPGVATDKLILGAGDYSPSKAVIDEVDRTQTRALETGGSDGRRVLHDIDTYLAGINTWLAANQPTTVPLTRADIYALNAFKGQFLGEGGGTEVENALALDAFQSRLGKRRGEAAYQDLRQRNDPESPVTAAKSFKNQTSVEVTKARGVVRLRRGSFKSSGPNLTASARTGRREASNALLVNGARSANGRPLMVAGPQLPYTYPGFTVEMGLYGPSIRTRGVTSAPMPGYMLIGRGTDFAWSLTAAGGDIIDVYAERLCGKSTTRYRFKGRCRTMTSLNAGTITHDGETVPVKLRRTVHGPVIGYAKEAGTGRRVALSRRRSSAGRDTLDQRFFQRLTYGRVHTAKQFVDAAHQSPQTFNSFYVSGSEIAMTTTGRLPVRPKGVNPDLPVDGSGRNEWRGYLSAAKHPTVVNPSSGVIVNWNNKPARNWPAGDDRWSEGSVQRAELLLDEVARTAKHTPATLTGAMNAAATQDVRTAVFWPVLRDVLAKTSAPSTRASAMAGQLQRWHDEGSSRLDRDLDGNIDAAGAAILDAAWPRLSQVGLCGRLGSAGCQALETRMSRFDTPPSGQYAGWHQYMSKDLRTLLGRKVAGRFRLSYCGTGSLKRCSSNLWAALEATGDDLAAKQGEDPAAWRERAERITFRPVPLTEIRYTNRPSGIQQIIQFGG
jgi:acyl-homoserine lactone acylase PvdQ